VAGLVVGRDLVQAEEFLGLTTTLTLATSIVNMWRDQPEHVARSFARVRRRHPGRFLTLVKLPGGITDGPSSSVAN
jgi:hypothetical protein